MYATPDTVEKMLDNPDLAIKMFEAIKEERIARVQAETRAKLAEHSNEVLMHTGKTYTVTEIAKEIGLRSASDLNIILEKKEIQFKRNNTRVLHSDYSARGYTSIKQNIINGLSVYNMQRTQAGRSFILSLDRKSTRLNSSHGGISRMPSSA